MREILFKAKSENIDGTFDWCEGYLSKCEGEWTICNDDGIGVFIDENTICQYTGMTDKKGKKIWENDRCEVYRFCVFAHGTIKFLEGCFCFVEDGTGNILRLCDIRTNNYEIKVVGGMDDGRNRIW